MIGPWITPKNVKNKYYRLPRADLQRRVAIAGFGNRLGGLQVKP